MACAYYVDQLFNALTTLRVQFGWTVSYSIKVLITNTAEGVTVGILFFDIFSCDNVLSWTRQCFHITDMSVTLNFRRF